MSFWTLYLSCLSQQSLRQDQNRYLSKGCRNRKKEEEIIMIAPGFNWITASSKVPVILLKNFNNFNMF